jgi:hypothetical protein
MNAAICAAIAQQLTAEQQESCAFASAISGSGPGPANSQQMTAVPGSLFFQMPYSMQ